MLSVVSRSVELARSVLRQAAVVVVMTMLGAVLVGGKAFASSESFPGCPLLLEGKSSGPCVEKLQRQLMAINSAHNLTITGVFDAPTRIAVLDFQGRNHLPADGNVGVGTARELQAQYDAIPTVDSPSPGKSNDPCGDILVSDGEGGCIEDGVDGGGKSAFDCLGQAFGDIQDAVAVHEAFTTFYAEGLRSRALYDAVAKKLGLTLTAGHTFKCAWWDLPSG